MVLNSKHHVDREASAPSVVKEIQQPQRTRRRHREHGELTLRPLWLKKYENRREHREDTENTENKLCTLWGEKIL